jgi:diadenosine tetraphosphate (Ap4A) HIT family hydrolase
MKNIDIQLWTRDDLKKKLAGKTMFWKEDCPFCIHLNENQYLLWKWEYWAIIHNQYPYIMDGTHFMLIPIRHICFSHEIWALEYSELPDAYAYIRDFYGGISYFSFTRESFNGRSVEHVHTHFISGNLPWKSIRAMLKNQGFDTGE